MKNLSEISKYKRVTVFILSLLIGITGAFSSEVIPIKNHEDQITTKSDQELPDSPERDNENSFTIKRQAISFSVQLTIIYQPLLLMNIIYDKNDNGKIENAQNEQHDEFFRRLFKRVISPNAP